MREVGERKKKKCKTKTSFLRFSWEEMMMPEPGILIVLYHRDKNEYEGSPHTRLRAREAVSAGCPIPVQVMVDVVRVCIRVHTCVL